MFDRWFHVVLVLPYGKGGASSNAFAKVDDLNFNRIMNKEVTLLGYNKNNDFDTDSAVQIGAHLNRYICHGLLSPCPGKEYTLDMPHCALYGHF